MVRFNRGNNTFKIDVYKRQGYSFKIFKRNPGEENSLPNSRIIALIEDKEQTIWIGTIGGGLVKYDYKTCLLYTSRCV